MYGRWAVAAGLLAQVWQAAAIPTASAEFRVCNKTDESVDVAFGYDGGGNAGWIAEGWFNVNVGRCVTVYGRELNNRYYYLYAEGANGTEWNGDDGEGSSFCVNRKVFKLSQSRYGSNEEEDCQKHNLESKRFFEVDVGDVTQWTQALEPEANQTAPIPQPPENSPAPSPSQPPPRGSACERFPNLC